MDTKKYFRRRGASRFMLDVVLLMNNTVQLKTLLGSDEPDMVVYFTGVLIVLSIILQVIVGILAVIQTCNEDKQVKGSPISTNPGQPAMNGDQSPSDNENQQNDQSRKDRINKILRLNTAVTALTFLILVVNVIIHTLGSNQTQTHPIVSSQGHVLPTSSSQGQHVPTSSK